MTLKSLLAALGLSLHHTIMKKETAVECNGVFQISVSESLYKSLNTRTSGPIPPSYRPKWKNMPYFLLNYLFIVIEVNTGLMTN